MKGPTVLHPKSVALIGSFKQHYEAVCDARKLFVEIGLEITSPQKTHILEEHIPFVRFASDRTDWRDPMVQTAALHRILRADFVYVVVPNHYVGKTTCYEIGRIIQASRPIYFSQHPDDLPISLPGDHICCPEDIVASISRSKFRPQPLFASSTTGQAGLEHDLLIGHYRTDEQLSHI